MTNYDAFAATFSQSRKNLSWPEVEYIVMDMKHHGSKHILDIGCGNGRLLEEIHRQGIILWSYLGIDNSLGMIEEARRLHGEYQFELCSMESLYTLDDKNLSFDAIIFLASFHHLETIGDRIHTLEQTRHLLTPDGELYMTNWNLRDQEMYQKQHQWNGDYAIKIGEFLRYYHGFTTTELEQLAEEAGYRIRENRIFDGGRNIVTILKKK